MGMPLWHVISQKRTATTLVQASFDRWKSGTGGPFELLAPDVEWTIVGSSPLAKTYKSKKEFIDEVIDPFNARMSKPLVTIIRGL
jgi:ketosteroid isomerase-like protein